MIAFLKDTIAAIITGGIAVAIFGQVQATRLRRKQLIAEAYQTALARVEVLYRIRRRTTSKALADQDTINIRDEMHDIQTKTDYYTGLLRTESTWFGKSYENLIDNIKKETEPLMQQAWTDNPKGVGVKLKNTTHPNVSTHKDQFLKDIRQFFNPYYRMWRAFQYWRGGENDG